MRVATDQSDDDDDNKGSASVMRFAQEEARRLGHNFVGTEQILIALIRRGGRLGAVLENFGITLNWARGEVETIVGCGSGFVAVEIPFTPRARRVLELSWDEARQLGHNFISPEHLMLAVLREGEGIACRILSDAGINTQRLRQAILKLFE
jgi:ATP-dependent Clp protease ATP-binding subunit ClpC